jgi:hypothetical protein
MGKNHNNLGIILYDKNNGKKNSWSLKRIVMAFHKNVKLELTTLFLDWNGVGSVKICEDIWFNKLKWK